LSKNNPNILELLNPPADTILHRHSLMDKIKTEMFLSKLCKQTFAGYAMSQIKKAKGLNKKIINPVEKERKSVIEFCHVIAGAGTVSLKNWLNQNNFLDTECGLVNVPHMRDVYGIFHLSQSPQCELRGIYSGENANDVLLSSIPKGIEPLAIMSFNKDGYSTYCKDYKEYWGWVDNRNEVRYNNTVEHGKNYDAKNMMHTFRLLTMAEEIARDGIINIRRQDREFLLSIKHGNFMYDDLVKMANEKLLQIDELYEMSTLPESPNTTLINDLLVEVREEFYKC